MSLTWQDNLLFDQGRLLHEFPAYIWGAMWNRDRCIVLLNCHAYASKQLEKRQGDSRFVPLESANVFGLDRHGQIAWQMRPSGGYTEPYGATAIRLIQEQLFLTDEGVRVLDPVTGEYTASSLDEFHLAHLKAERSNGRIAALPLRLKFEGKQIFEMWPRRGFATLEHKIVGLKEYNGTVLVLLDDEAMGADAGRGNLVGLDVNGNIRWQAAPPPLSANTQSPNVGAYEFLIVADHVGIVAVWTESGELYALDHRSGSIGSFECKYTTNPWPELTRPTGAMYPSGSVEFLWEPNRPARILSTSRGGVRLEYDDFMKAER